MSFDGLDKRVSYATVWIGVPVPVTIKGWRCSSCGHRWTDSEKPEDPPQ